MPPSIPMASNNTQNTGMRRGGGSWETPIDLTADSPKKPNKGKRRAPDDLPPSYAPAPKRFQQSGPTPSKGKAPEKPAEEKRLKRWRDHAPSTYHTIRARALTQRMIVLDRHRDEIDPSHPIEIVTMAGTTGNIYEVIIDKVPSCSCPHALKGNQCKHIVYVLSRVLRVDAKLEYQVAFVSEELREIFRKAPPLPEKLVSRRHHEEEGNGNRKPLEGECPICCEDFDLGGSSREEIVYCKASCGNNIHKVCFDRWAKTKAAALATCPFCRAQWVGEDLKSYTSLANNAKMNSEGYYNVAQQLGIEEHRDFSTYNEHWYRRYRQGWYDY